MKEQTKIPKMTLSPRVARISSALSMREGSERGFAAITALAFLAISGILVATALFLGMTNRRLASETVRTANAQYAAEAGIEVAVNQLYLQPLKGSQQSLRKMSYYVNLLNNYTVPAAMTHNNIAKKLVNNDTAGLTFGGSTLDGYNYKTNVVRRDVVDTLGNVRSVVLTINSIGSGIDQSGTDVRSTTNRIISQTITINSTGGQNLDFALMSNQINCTFCHTKISSLEAQYGNGAGNAFAGTTRVKAASLQTLEMRTAKKADGTNSGSMWDAPDTTIAGTLYSRGDIKDQNNSIIDNSRLNSEAQLKFIQRDQTTSGFNQGILTDTKELTKGVDCSSLSTPCDPKGNNLYRNYQNEVDGSVPTEFPLPVPDLDGNREIDNNEWVAAISDNFAEDGGVYGSITGGTKNFMPTTIAETLGSTLVTRNVNGISTPIRVVNQVITNGAVLNNISDSGLTSAIASGTAANSNKMRGIPGNLEIKGDFVINGTVFVDGDVVISGKMSGKGKIIARGNIYVVGDLTYKCDGGCDYSKPDTLPQLGLLSGGNVLVGDYMSRKGARRADLLDPNAIEIPVGQLGYGSSISKITAAGAKATFGGNVRNVNGGALNDTDTVQVSIAMAQVSMFNRAELDRAKIDLTYIPRLYKFRDSDPPLFYKGSGGEGADVYDTGQLALASTRLEFSRAQVISLSPTANWLAGTEGTSISDPYSAEKSIKARFINNVEKSTDRLNGRPNRGDKEALQVDAVLYSGNSAFALARGSTNVAETGRSVINGKLTINGSMIAADLGIMAAGNGAKQRNDSDSNDSSVGFHINYDRRAPSMLRLKGTGQVFVERSYFSLTKGD